MPGVYSKEVRLACRAMATRFELVLYGVDEVRLRAAGEEAIREIVRLDAELSAFRPQSPISRINRSAFDRSVTATHEIVCLLQRVKHLSDVTEGTFDATVGPLLRTWGFRGPVNNLPSESEIAEALGRVGMGHVEVDNKRRSIRFDRAGMQLDLGGVGKGYALDVATEVIRSAGIDCALIHGGTSTVRAIGRSPDGKSWKVAIRPPFDAIDASPLQVVNLDDDAMSVSAVSGRSFMVDGRVYGHVIDPRTGYPVNGAEMAIVVVPNATDADALSTALLVLGESGVSVLEQRVDSFKGSILAGEPASDTPRRVASGGIPG